MADVPAGVMRALAHSQLLWNRHLQRTLEARGLTLKQYYLLRQLSRRGTMFPAQAAEELFCDRPTASVVIRNMERRGWLTRERDAANGKRTLVRLTPAGRRKLAEVDAHPPTPRRPGLDPLGCFDPAERQTLARLLPRLRDHLAAITARQTRGDTAEED